MAELEVSKRQSQSERGGVLSRRAEQMPSLFAHSPSELFALSPFALMRRLSEDMDRWFSSGGGRSENALWAPPVEIRQEGGNLKVVAELPGLKPEDVKLELTDEGVIIQGERKKEHEEREQGVVRSERSYGFFYRFIPLPEGAKTDDAKAEFRNGELRITIPVAERKEKRREIPIHAASEQQKPGEQPKKS